MAFDEISAPVPKRKSMSKKLRFDVFKRDGFKCMYCGAHPPGVLLHVDHIKPVADGGKNNIDNLITACEPCNLGKGARLLSSVPMDLSEKAEAVKEREAQIKGYQSVMEGKRLRLDREAWSVVHLLLPGVDTASRDWMNSLRSFIDKLGVHDVTEAMEIALAKGFYSNNKTWRYFCGICWNKLRKAEGGE
jgi:5-methylcytosine-specific restriction endonuclease McrA